jgi:hypothetical protein
MALGAAEGAGLLDRADALVWALTALMLERGGAAPRVRVFAPPSSRAPSRGISASVR